MPMTWQTERLRLMIREAEWLGPVIRKTEWLGPVGVSRRLKPPI